MPLIPVTDFNNQLVYQGQAAHWAQSAVSAPDSLTAVCPEEKRREKRMA